MKTSELTGAALNWAVNHAEGLTDMLAPVNYCDKWEFGGPIIEREGIDLHRVTGALWSASWWANNSGMAKNPTQRFKHNITTDGPTPLVAAMRCYVASKLGDEVNLPADFA